MHLLSGAVEEFDGLPNLEEATQRYHSKVNGIILEGENETVSF